MFNCVRSKSESVCFVMVRLVFMVVLIYCYLMGSVPCPPFVSVTYKQHQSVRLVFLWQILNLPLSDYYSPATDGSVSCVRLVFFYCGQSQCLSYNQQWLFQMWCGQIEIWHPLTSCSFRRRRSHGVHTWEPWRVTCPCSIQ